MTVKLNIKSYTINLLSVVFRLSRKIVWKCVQSVLRWSSSEVSRFNSIFFDDVLRLKIASLKKNHLCVIDVSGIFKRITSTPSIDSGLGLIAALHIPPMTQHWYLQRCLQFSCIMSEKTLPLFNVSTTSSSFWNPTVTAIFAITLSKLTNLQSPSLCGVAKKASSVVASLIDVYFGLLSALINACLIRSPLMLWSRSRIDLNFTSSLSILIASSNSFALPLNVSLSLSYTAVELYS